VSLVVVGVLVALGLSVVAPAGGGAIPQVGSIRADSGEGTVTFRWDDPGLVEGDSYLVRVTGPGGMAEGMPQNATSYTVSTVSGRVCVTVTVLRGVLGGQQSGSACSG
jgi:hypothetical protein